MIQQIIQMIIQIISSNLRNVCSLFQNKLFKICLTLGKKT